MEREREGESERARERDTYICGSASKTSGLYAEDYSTLHRGARQRFVTEGGTATNPYFEALPYVHVLPASLYLEPFFHTQVNSSSLEP